ncbi:MAG: ATP-binding cassette domain-containing protein [Bacilli bacterium]|nr:ATP-binding cassette domain-containing protein [Bacilli bacterium]
MRIKIEHLNKKFGHIEILKDINYEFQGGNIYGITGHNGSGKSVLLKIITGLYFPSSGTVLFNDINIHKKKIFLPNARALIDKPNFISELTGKENLDILLNIEKKYKYEDIEFYLKELNLFNYMDLKYCKYSFGMKQKLGIIQVLMEEPDIIILDEPFNGVDKKATEKIKKILIDLRKKGKLILVTGHNILDLNEICDEIIELENGELITKVS